MALNREDKADVSKAMGKALANKVEKVTRDSNKTSHYKQKLFKETVEKRRKDYVSGSMPKNIREGYREANIVKRHTDVTKPSYLKGGKVMKDRKGNVTWNQASTVSRLSRENPGESKRSVKNNLSYYDND